MGIITFLTDREDATLVTPEVKPYFEAFEDFLRELQGHDVTAIAMVALCSDEDTHDVVSNWHCGPFEMAAAAGVLQLHAGFMYNDANANEEEGEEE